MEISPELFFTHVWHVPGQPVAYVINPKAACSSILTSLWVAHDQSVGTDTFPGDPHLKVPTPFCKNLPQAEGELEALFSSRFFSVVRNPFARFLSAYLDKVVRRKDERPWRSLSARLRFPEEETPSPDVLLRALRRAKLARVDWHFRPQSLNLFADLVPLDFLGHVESLGSTADFLASHGIEFRPNFNNRTGASEKIRDHLADDAIDLIREIYARDFEAFGYAADPSQLSPVREALKRSADRSRLRAWASAQFAAKSSSNMA